MALGTRRALYPLVFAGFALFGCASQSRLPATSLQESPVQTQVQTQALTLIVSDYDDTLKISNALRKTSAAWNVFFQDALYPGMATLIRGWKQESPELHFAVLSNSPKLLQRKVQGNLARNDLSPDSLHLRDPETPGPVHKLASLAAILSREASGVVLLGDNAEKDPEIYSKAVLKAALYAPRVYIHRVRCRGELPKGQIPYVTSFEVAFREALMGRIPVDTALDVGQEILKSRPDHVIPTFACCPQQGIGICKATSEQSLQAMCLRVDAFVQAACASRR